MYFLFIQKVYTRCHETTGYCSKQKQKTERKFKKIDWSLKKNYDRCILGGKKKQNDYEHVHTEVVVTASCTCTWKRCADQTGKKYEQTFSCTTGTTERDHKYILKWYSQDAACMPAILEGIKYDAVIRKAISNPPVLKVIRSVLGEM